MRELKELGQSRVRKIKKNVYYGAKNFLNMEKNTGKKSFLVTNQKYSLKNVD